jgi:undecaprenyl-phosphate 4-deoxy-4-formamido-L-arabinose transferase
LIQLSFVIPVYNGAQSIARVVGEIHNLFAKDHVEVVLVNDGSPDNSEAVCRELAAAGQAVFVQLARNFGEHNAVLAGLSLARGQYVAVLDDDGQNPPSEVRKLWDHAKATGLDVVYGRYAEKKHSVLRNLGSQFNDRVANHMLRKPSDIYLSSFKVMSRFVVDEIVKYRGPYPYIDGLIFRATRSIGQIEVNHKIREQGKSNYTVRKLLKLWSNMFLSFSIAPLRFATALGLVMASLSALAVVLIIVDKLWINPGVTAGIPTVLALVSFLAGVQLLMLGIIGEYLGRLYMDQTGSPQFVVRYVSGTAFGQQTRVPHGG